MGEAKRKAARMTPHDLAMQELARRLTDEGKIIEAGWIGLRTMWLHPDAPETQVQDLRAAFMAGALHLFRSINQVLEPGDDATVNDEARMEKIDTELREFGAEMQLRATTTQGRA